MSNTPEPSSPSTGLSPKNVSTASRYVSPLDTLASHYDKEVQELVASKDKDWARAVSSLRAARMKLTESGIYEIVGATSLLKHHVVPTAIDSLTDFGFVACDAFTAVYSYKAILGVLSCSGDAPAKRAAGIAYLLGITAVQTLLEHPIMLSQHPSLVGSDSFSLGSYAVAMTMLSMFDPSRQFFDERPYHEWIASNGWKVPTPNPAYGGSSVLTVAASFAAFAKAHPDEMPVCPVNVYPSSIAPGIGKDQNDARSIMIQQIISTARSVRGLNATPGKVPSGSDGVNMLLQMTTPKVPYLDVIRRALRENFARDTEEPSWRRLNPKFQHSGISFPSPERRPLSQGLLFGVDVSSSAVDYLSKFFAEIAGLVEAIRPPFVTVLYVTTHVMQAEKFEGSKLRNLRKSARPVGHGGTDMRTIINWINDPECRSEGHEDDVYQMFLCYTDGETPWPSLEDIKGTPADVPHFWVEPFAPDSYWKRPETGRVLLID